MFFFIISTVEFVQSLEISFSWRSGLTRFFFSLACSTLWIFFRIVSIKVSNGQCIFFMVLFKWISFDTSHNAPGAAHIEHDIRDTWMILFFIVEKTRIALRIKCIKDRMSGLEKSVPCNQCQWQRDVFTWTSNCTAESRKILVQYSHEYMCVFDVWLPLIIFAKAINSLMWIFCCAHWCGFIECGESRWRTHTTTL